MTPSNLLDLRPRLIRKQSLQAKFWPMPGGWLASVDVCGKEITRKARSRNEAKTRIRNAVNEHFKQMGIDLVATDFTAKEVIH